MTSRKTIRGVQQELALSLGFGDQIIWDFYSAGQSNVLGKKIRELLPDQPKNQQAIEKMREDLFTSVWNQRKYDNGTLYSCIFYVAVTNDKEPEQATEFSIHPVFRIRKCVAEGDSTDCCMIYVDEIGRVYQNWESYINENVLPPGLMVVPNRGVYNFENGHVVLAIYSTPNGKLQAILLEQVQKGASVVGFGAACVSLAASVYSIPPPIVDVINRFGYAMGTMTGVLSATNLVDRSNHEQSIQITDRDARGSWLGVACGLLGPASLGATTYMTRMAAAGEVTSGLEFFVNSMNITSIVLSGSGLGVGILDLILKYKNGDDVSPLDVMQLAASLVLFTHSVYNFQMASSIADNARNGHIEKYRESLYKRQRKIFDKYLKETARIRGDTQGKIDIIRHINDIPERQFLNNLFKIDKQLNQNKTVAPKVKKVLQNNVTVDASAQRRNISDQNGPNVSTSVIKPKPKAVSTTTNTNTTTSYEPIPVLNHNVFLLLANGSKIHIKGFGHQFCKNIYNWEEWSKLTEFIASKFPEDIMRFLMNLSKTFIERLHECRDMVFQKDISTESILFRIVKYCYSKLGEDRNFHYLVSISDEILEHLDGLIKWNRTAPSIEFQPVIKNSLEPSKMDKKLSDSTITKKAHSAEIRSSTENAPMLSNPNEEFPGFFIVAENGAPISFKDFGLEFLINILDRKALYRVTEFLCLNFSEKTVRFLFDMTRRFVDHSSQHLNFELRVIVTTESILFQIFKCWDMNFNDDIEHDHNIIDKVITNVRLHFMIEKNYQNINEIPDRQNLQDLLKLKKQLKLDVPTHTGIPSLRKYDMLLNNELNAVGTEPQNDSNVLQSESTIGNASTIEDSNPDSENINSFTIQENGAMISLSEFGQHFNKHVVDSPKLNELIEYLCSNLSEETVRFLLNLTNSFIEKYGQRIEGKLKTILTTEPVLFLIFKFCHNKYKENLNFEYLRLKCDEIVANTFFTYMPTNRTNEPQKIKCKNCKGFYSISDV
uniref:DUF4781 domain-containing protein n=1 Tax=Glossina pallidipes TaxID=7398 RepID=A0A1A9ZJL0_GLOPL